MKLTLGTHLSCNGPYGGSGIVAAIHGELGSERSRPLGGGVVLLEAAGATLDVIYDDGRLAAGLRESFLRDPTPWRVLDRPPADPAAIAAAWAMHAAYKATEAAKKDEASAAYAAAKAALPAEYPYLATSDPKGGALTLAAKNLRAMLKRAFPATKFSVTTERFSMGNSLTVAWTDGPAGAAVDAIAQQFSAGNFDGYDDCYRYDKSPWTDLFGSAKYVHTYRRNSPAAVLAACQKVLDTEPCPAGFSCAATMAAAFERGAINDYWTMDAIRAALGEKAPA